MAKKAKAKKLTTQELEEVREAQGNLNQAIFNLGAHELTRVDLLTKHASAKGLWQTQVKELEEKYGRVNINLDNGQIEEPKEEEDN